MSQDDENLKPELKKLKDALSELQRKQTLSSRIGKELDLCRKEVLEKIHHLRTLIAREHDE